MLPDDADVVVGLGVLRIEPDRLLEQRERLVVAIRPAQHAQVVGAQPAGRIAAQGLAVDRLSIGIEVGLAPREHTQEEDQQNIERPGDRAIPPSIARSEGRAICEWATIRIGRSPGRSLTRSPDRSERGDRRHAREILEVIRHERESERVEVDEAERGKQQAAKQQQHGHRRASRSS